MSREEIRKAVEADPEMLKAFDMACEILDERAANEGLRAFVEESNRIEGIDGIQDHEVQAHRQILDVPDGELTAAEVRNFAYVVAGASLREHPGQDVVIREGATILHRPMPGGPHMTSQLTQLVAEVERSPSIHGDDGPWVVHCTFEEVHPFTDGNGRTGRVLWLRMMKRQIGLKRALSMPFLHRWYYQSLQGART